MRLGSSMQQSATRVLRRGRVQLGLLAAALANAAVTALAAVGVTAASITAAAGQVVGSAMSDLGDSNHLAFVSYQFLPTVAEESK